MFIIALFSLQIRNGGWDKCLGPFNHLQAKEYGVDMWDCHSGNCYVRKDPNGGIGLQTVAYPTGMYNKFTNERINLRASALGI